jgi:hypothetical protein
MIQSGIEAQDGGCLVVKAQFQFRPQPVGAERNAPAQHALAFQILDDVFRIGRVVFVTDRKDVDFGWLRFVTNNLSKPLQHDVVIVV